MATKRKKIEFFKVEIKSDNDNNTSFDQILSHNDIVDREFPIRGKFVSYRIIEQYKNIIIGIVETNRNDNIPPKKHRRKKTIGPLGLENGEGLAYGNIFLYEPDRKILLYEVNKFGCYIDHFIEYIYKANRNSETFNAFDIRLDPVLKTNEYQRMLSMDFYKSIELQIAHPDKILEDHTHANDALLKVCSSASDLKSTRLYAKFEVSAKKNLPGLSSRTIKSLVDEVLKVIRGPKGENVQKIQVVGYETDSEDNKLQPIDLLADRYLKYIELDEPRENSDLLEYQRKTQIETLYTKCLPDFKNIFSKNEKK